MWHLALTGGGGSCGTGYFRRALQRLAEATSALDGRLLLGHLAQ